MRLDFVMLADSAVLDAKTGKLDIIGGGVTHITAPKLPFPAPAVSIVVRFIPEAGDQGDGRVLSIRLRDPDGKQMFTIAGAIDAGHEHWPRAHEGEEPTLIVVGRLEGIVFEAYGRHTFELLLDDDPIAERHLAVVPTRVPDNPNDT